MNTTDLKPGLKNPVQDAQAMFRHLMVAMSRPGTVQFIDGYCEAISALNPVMAAAALTMMDYETPFWLADDLNENEIAYYLSFHTGAKRVEDPSEAAFLLTNSYSWLPELKKLPLGNPEYPDSSATIFIGAEAFNTGQRVTLSGPGIETTVRFGSESLNDDFWQFAVENHALYPLGLDFFFCSNNELAALPRSTKVEV